jgi:hypothetical protein
MIDDLRRVAHTQLQLDVEAGVGDATTLDPQVMVRWSDDAGHTYGAEHWVAIGAQGQYGRRVVLRRLGHAREGARVYEVSGTDPVKIVLLNAYVETVDGRH